MAHGQPQMSRRFCKACDQHRMFERRAIDFSGRELLLTLATLGAYLLVKQTVMVFRNPWRCVKCGERSHFWGPN